MSVNSIKASISVMQSSQTLNATSPIISMEGQIIGLLRTVSSLLIIIGLIVGILYILKSKKTNVKKFFIGFIIIIVPFILNIILNIIKLNMVQNM